jgi:phenylacetate-CoA ligase
MFVRPEQIAEIGKHHAELGRLRLVVSREDETDVMTLRAECGSPSEASQREALQHRLTETLRNVTKLGSAVEIVAAGSLPNDGKAISDERKL